MHRRPTKLVEPEPPREGWLPKPDERMLSELQAHAMMLWRERAEELDLPIPSDLSGSCRFTSLFVQSLFGGDIRGNWDHFHVRTRDGTVIDLNASAEDVLAIKAAGRDPYRHERRFVSSRDVREIFDTCRPRVEAWTSEWLRTHPRRPRSEIDVPA